MKQINDEANNDARSIITIASGLSTYFQMAVNLARSVEFHNPKLAFYILTDREHTIPKELRNTHLIIVPCLDRGFKAKLSVDFYFKTLRTLFLDSDCLVLGDLSPLFDAFSGQSVGVLGIQRFTGEFFGDISAIRTSLDLPYLLQFNGGVYYFESGDLTSAIMNYARSLLPRYDEIGFVRLRNQANEEVLISAALARFSRLPVENNGDLYADFQWWPKLIKFRPLSGEAVLENPPHGSAGHQASFPAKGAAPLVLHFLGHHVESWMYMYARFAYYFALRKYPFPSTLAVIVASPKVLTNAVRNNFRPIYRRLFGTRVVKRSNSRQMSE